ncbi:hypothetical protein C4K68_18855, partial [Pokkaliibacter plantistimulans]
PAGTTSAELTIVAADDNVYEGVEGFTVSVTDAQINGQALNDASADGSIADEDGDVPQGGDIPTVSVTAVQPQATEPADDGSQTNAVFTIDLSNPSEYATTMTVSVAPSATDGIEQNDVQTL